MSQYFTADPNDSKSVLNVAHVNLVSAGNTSGVVTASQNGYAAPSADFGKFNLVVTGFTAASWTNLPWISAGWYNTNTAAKVSCCMRIYDTVVQKWYSGNFAFYVVVGQPAGDIQLVVGGDTDTNTTLTQKTTYSFDVTITGFTPLIVFDCTTNPLRVTASVAPTNSSKLYLTYVVTASVGS